MPVIAIDTGGPQPVQVQVDDSFNSLSHDEQNETVQKIHDQLVAQNPPDTSSTSALRYGASQAAGAVGSTLTDLGGVASRNGLPNVGSALGAAGGSLTSAGQSIAPAPNYQPAVTDAIAKFKAGRYLDALRDVPRAGLEALPSMAGTLGAGAIGGALAPELGVAGAGAAIAAQTLGPTADQRAANNGHPGQTTTEDVLGALPSTAVQTALGVAGGGQFGPVARQIERLPGIAQPVAKAASEAVANATNDAAQQLGQSVGTEKGAQFDPAETAVAAGQGAASRAGTAAPEVVSRAVGAAVNEGMARLQPKIADPLQAASVVRIGQELQDATLDAVQNGNGKVPAPNVILNQLKTTKNADLATQVRTMRDNGIITPEQALLLTTWRDQALRHNSTIDPDAFATIDSLNVPPDTKQALTNGFRDLNTLSTQSFEKNLQGPFQKLGSVLGMGASIGAGLLSGDPVEGALGVAGALVGRGGHGIASAVGGGLGRLADQAFGTQTPSVVLQQMRARQVLNRFGITDVGPTSASQLAGLRANPVDPAASLLARYGITPAAPKPDVVPLTPEQQRAYEVKDALALDRQLNQQRSLQVGDAQALDRQLNQQRGLEVQDAQALDQQQTRAAAANAQSVAMMNRLRVKSLMNARASQMRDDAQQRALEVGDASALDRQLNQQRGLQVSDAQALDRQRTQQANEEARTQAQGDADVAAMAAKDRATKAAQVEAAIRAHQKVQATADSIDSTLREAEADAAKLKQQQEDAMWNAANKLQNQEGRRVAGATAAEVQGHSQAMAFKAAQTNRVRSILTKAGNNIAAATNRNETAANLISGQAYKALPARVARANGVVGAKATDVGASPAYKATGGAYGAPAGEAPMVTDTPAVKGSGARASAEAPGGPASGSKGAPAATLAAGTGKASSGPSAASVDSVTPAGPPAGFGEAPPEGVGIARGWKAYVQQGLRHAGVDATPDDINVALAHTVTNGSLARAAGADPATPASTMAQMAHDLATGKVNLEMTNPAHQRIANAIFAQVAQNKQLLGNLDPHSGGFIGQRPGSGGSAQPEPNGGPRGPILNAARWKGAAATAQHYAAGVATREEARGDNALAHVVRQIAATPLATDKAKLAQDFLARLPQGNADYAKHATQVLTDKVLLKGASSLPAKAPEAPPKKPPQKAADIVAQKQKTTEALKKHVASKGAA